MLNFRKRISIFPGIKINLSKSGASLSVGTKGASVTLGKSGAYVNTGIPGTGLYQRTKLEHNTQPAETNNKKPNHTYHDSTIEALYVGPDKSKTYKCNGCNKISSVINSSICPKCGRFLSESELYTTGTSKRVSKNNSLFIKVIKTIIAVCVLIIIITSLIVLFA